MKCTLLKFLFSAHFMYPKCYFERAEDDTLVASRPCPIQMMENFLLIGPTFKCFFYNGFQTVTSLIYMSFILSSFKDHCPNHRASTIPAEK